MNVLYVDATGTRGVAEKFAACMNRYHPDHAARACVPASFFDRTPSYLPPHLYDVRDRAVLDDCLRWADVVHLIHQTSYRSIGRPDLIGKKPTIYQRFTLIDKGDWAQQIWQKDDWKHLKLAVVAEGWQRYRTWSDRSYRLLPAPFPIEDKEYLPIPMADRKPYVCFTPMNKNPGPPAPKAFDATAHALKGLELVVMFRRPFAECMAAKARAWVGIDEVETPIVHFSLFEFLSLGVPCISRVDTITLDTVKLVTGASSVPILHADIASLRIVAEEALRTGAEDMDKLSGELRGWMERYMHPRDVMARYLAFYGEAA